jgi:putative addiction module antidote
VMPALKRKVRKVGNSLTLTIPVEIIEIMKLKEGDDLSVDIIEGKMIVSQFSIKKEEQP